MLTGASQISGVGVWVSAAELFPSQESPFQTSAELEPSLATTAADSTINRRSDGSAEHHLPNITNLTKRYCVKADLAKALW